MSREINAAMVKWYNGCLPSTSRGFDYPWPHNTQNRPMGRFCAIRKISDNNVIMSHQDDFDFYCEVALKPDADIKKVFENERILAFHHTKPYWETHIVVIPKEHIWDLRHLPPALLAELMAVVQTLCQNLEEPAISSGVQVLTNLGSRQDTPHFHIHIGIGAPLQNSV